MQSTRINSIQFRNLGLIDYKEAWDLQEKTLDTVVKEKQESATRNAPKSQVV
jgi:hypothetical protein